MITLSSEMPISVMVQLSFFFFLLKKKQQQQTFTAEAKRVSFFLRQHWNKQEVGDGRGSVCIDL